MLAATLAVVGVGCSSSVGGGPRDSGGARDAGFTDAGVPDGPADAGFGDAVSADAGVPDGPADAGFGDAVSADAGVPDGPLDIGSADAGFGDAGPAGLSPCIADWPSASRAPRQRTALDTGPPRILWSKKIGDALASISGRLFDNTGLVLAGGHLVFAPGGGPLVIMDKKTGNSTTSAPTFSVIDSDSPATVDEDGNIYSVAMSGVYSFDGAGEVRWRLPTSNQTGGEFAYFYPPALGPDGVLYTVCADGYLRAIGTRDGREIWRQPAQVQGYHSRVMGGAGGAVFMLSGVSGVWAYATKSGANLGEFRTASNQSLSAWIGLWALGWDFQVQFGAICSFDVCGRQRWSTLRDALYEDHSGVIALGERLVATKWDVDSKGQRLTADRMYLYAPDGTVVKGPVSAQGEPYLAGADGTIYTVNCVSSSPKANEIIAYSSDLKELWRLSLGAENQCPGGNGVLDDDGVLYLARGTSGALADGGGRAEIVAIQTQSPGLAESSWPSLRHDNRGTMWLTPLPPLSGSNPAVDTSVPAAVDASIDMSIASNPAMDSSVPTAVDTSIDLPLDRPGQIAE
jgi:hypothetical protein